MADWHFNASLLPHKQFPAFFLPTYIILLTLKIMVVSQKGSLNLLHVSFSYISFQCTLMFLFLSLSSFLSILPLILSIFRSSPHRRWMLQTDVKVFGLVRLHTAQGHPRLPDELVMCQFVLVTHGHPGSERQTRKAVKTREWESQRAGARKTWMQVSDADLWCVCVW